MEGKGKENKKVRRGENKEEKWRKREGGLKTMVVKKQCRDKERRETEK